MALLGYPRGHRIDPETRYCMTVSERLMSAWILSLEPERRRTDGPPPGMKTWDPLEFCATLKRLASSVVRRRNDSSFRFCLVRPLHGQMVAIKSCRNTTVSPQVEKLVLSF